MQWKWGFGGKKCWFGGPTDTNLGILSIQMKVAETLKNVKSYVLGAQNDTAPGILSIQMKVAETSKNVVNNRENRRHIFSVKMQ